MHYRFFLDSLFSLFIFFLLCSCTPLPSSNINWVDRSVHLVWPQPPNLPRIAYLRSLGNPVQLQEEWGGSRFLRWLTGDSEEVYPLLSPYGVAADGAGRIWVADVGIKGVHVFDLARREITYLFSAGNVPFESPVGVAIDLVRDQLYISDSVLQRIFVFTLSGKFLGERRFSDGFGRPAGMAVDTAGQLYVVDVVKRRVSVFSHNGDLLRHITSQRSPDISFLFPSNVAVDPLGQVYVSDTMHFQVEVFDREGRSLEVIGGVGDGPGAFARPRGVALDSDGHIYVVDAAFGNVQVFDSTGQLLVYFGGNGKEPGYFSLPAGIFIDQYNRIYVVDAHNQRIQIFRYLGDVVQ